MIGTAEVKSRAQEILKPLAEGFKSLGITPNLLTIAGFIFSMLSGFLICANNLIGGAFFFALSGLCDMLDGILARTTNSTTKFGAFLDSFLDRYADFFPLSAIAFLAFKERDTLLLGFSLLSLMGSFATSYARARAESLGADCRAALFERPERFLIILLSLLTGYLNFFMGVLAVFSNVTAVQRLVCAFKRLK